MAVVLRYLAGLPGRRCYLYDLLDPTGGEGEGKRLPAQAPDLFERVSSRFGGWHNIRVCRGKVSQVLGEIAPRRIAFLHVDMNNADAERTALDVLFDRISPGGIIVFDDYGWSTYRGPEACGRRIHAHAQPCRAGTAHRTRPGSEAVIPRRTRRQRVPL